MKLTLMKKLSLFFLLAIIGAIVLTSVISNYTVGKEFQNYLIDEHKLKINDIIKIIEEQYTDGNSFLNINYSEIQRYAQLQELYIEIKSIGGNIIYSSGDSYLKHKVMMEQMMGYTGQNFNEMDLGKYIENEFALTVNDQSIGTVKIGYFGTSYLSYGSVTFINTLNKSFIISALIALIFGFIICIIISRQISKPIIKITETANKMRDGNLKVKANVITNTKEISELANSINYLADTLSNQEMLRKRMTSDIAHEIRTPLTTLKTYMEAFIDGVWEPTEERQEAFYEEIERLTKLTDNLRDLSKIEQENQQLNKINIDISQELEKIIETFKPLYSKKNYTLISNIAPKINAFVDKDKLKQIMNNMLSNSYNYLNPNGTVNVTLKRDKNNIIIEVKDNGIGISQKDLPYVFERFYRSDISRTKNTGGSGIGLTITKSFVEAHGGKINVISKENEGTIFNITLPIK